MSEEFYLDPIDSITDPKVLRTKQFMRTMSWDSVVSMFWLAATITPIAIAITKRDLAQVLKISYAPLSLLGSGIVLNFKPFHLWASNLFYFAPFGLIVLALVAISHISPIPYWYSATIPIQFYLFWKTQREIPAKERQEWEQFKKNTGLTDEAILTILQKKSDRTDR